MHIRPVIKENTACVVVAHQSKQCVIAMTCDSKSNTIIGCVVSLKLNICKKKKQG